MSETLHNTLEQAALLVPHVHHGALLVLDTVAGAAAAAVVHQRHEHTKQQDVWPCLLRVCISSRFQGYQESNRKHRLRPTYALIAGTALLGAGATVASESITPNRSANEVIVSDASLSMVRTHDLGETNVSRFSATAKGITTADFAGKLSVIQVGAENSVVLPLDYSWQDNKKRITTPSVDPNGGELVSALKRAESILPLDGHRRNGGITIISDGTIENSPAAVAKEANQLRKEGVKVNVIVPGTEGGKYTFSSGGAPQAAGVQPETFDGFGAKNVVRVETADEVTEAVKQHIEAGAGKSTKHELPYIPAIVLSAAALGYSALTFSKRTINKVG